MAKVGSSARRLINRLLGVAGYEIVRLVVRSGESDERGSRAPGRPDTLMLPRRQQLRNKGETLRLLRELGFAPDLIFDIGVANGTPGLYDEWPGAHYVLVEPRVECEPALRSICSGLKSAEYHLAAAGGEVSLSRRMTTVDALFARHAQSARCVLKIDVDGPELDVLAGAGNLLTRDVVVIIEVTLLNQGDSHVSGIVRLMHERGYECFDILEPLYRPSDNLLWQVDLVFVHRESTLRQNRQYRAS